MQVGTTKDQGLYNKPSAAVHPGELAAGTLPKYNTINSLLSPVLLLYVLKKCMCQLTEDGEIIKRKPVGVI